MGRPRRGRLERSKGRFVGDKPVVRIHDSIPQLPLGAPAHLVKPGAIENLARSSIGFGKIKGNSSLEAHHLGYQSCQIADGDFLA